MFKGLSNVTAIMRQAQIMGGKLNELNDKLKSLRASGTAGGGMVIAEVNGLGELLRVTIEPELVERGDREMIEDLIPAAVNQAATKAKQLHMEAMQSVTSGINVPGLQEAISQLSNLLGDEAK